jgi:hypothetical protein
MPLCSRFHPGTKLQAGSKSTPTPGRLPVTCVLAYAFAITGDYESAPGPIATTK